MQKKSAVRKNVLTDLVFLCYISLAMKEVFFLCLKTRNE